MKKVSRDEFRLMFKDVESNYIASIGNENEIEASNGMSKGLKDYISKLKDNNCLERETDNIVTSSKGLMDRLA